jgi:hypothetical protein
MFPPLRFWLAFFAFKVKTNIGPLSASLGQGQCQYHFDDEVAVAPAALT